MKQIKIVHRWNKNKILVSGKYGSIKNCLEENRGAYLGGADLRGAYLRGADLRGVKNYYMSHDFFVEIIRRQPINIFIDKEWVMIGQTIIDKFCWEEIKRRYGKAPMRIFKILAKVGFDEWEKYYKELLKKD